MPPPLPGGTYTPTASVSSSSLPSPGGFSASFRRAATTANVPAVVTNNPASPLRWGGGSTASDDESVTGGARSMGSPEASLVPSAASARAGPVIGSAALRGAGRASMSPEGAILRSTTSDIGSPAAALLKAATGLALESRGIGPASLAAAPIAYANYFSSQAAAQGRAAAVASSAAAVAPAPRAIQYIRRGGVGGARQDIL